MEKIDECFENENRESTNMQTFENTRELKI